MQRSSGFTLLEVMVALTITAMALGALFSVIAGNKRLAWSAEAALVRAMQVRSLINVAQLSEGEDEIFLSEEHKGLDLASGEALEPPTRKTEATLQELHGFRITDDSGATLAQGTYWVQQEVPIGDAIGDGARVQPDSNPFGQSSERQAALPPPRGAVPAQ